MRERANPNNKAERFAEWVRERLAGSFREAAWEVSRPAASPVDLLCLRPPQAYAVELKVSAERARGPLMRALLADAILRARVHGESVGAHPLAVIAAPMISDRIANDLQNYVDSYASGVSWGVLDAQGRFELHGIGLEDLSPPQDNQHSSELGELIALRPRAKANPFSDLGQWMIKVLLASKLPKKDWLNVVPRPIRSIQELASLAEVSLASASKLLKALEELGHLNRRSDRSYELVRVRPLMEAWRSASSGPFKEVPARFMIPGKDPIGQLKDRMVHRIQARNYAPPDLEEWEDPVRLGLGPVGSRACLGLFSAADAAHALIVRGAPIYLYLENLSSNLLGELGLIQVDHPSEAELIVRQPNYAESVFRGALQYGAKPNVLCSDLVQCWLDISNHPARGQEQAASLASMLQMEEW